MRRAIHRTTGLRAFTRRIAAVGAVVVLALVATPATASAAGPADVEPVLNCVMKNPNGSFTAVLGYLNSSSSTASIPVGSNNRMYPDDYNDELPTTFLSGRRNGVFTITLPRYGVALWRVGYDFLTITENAAAACPPSTQMPGQGNGLGPVMGLGIAGVLGAIVIRRVRRLAETPVPAPGTERVGTDA